MNRKALVTGISSIEAPLGNLEGGSSTRDCEMDEGVSRSGASFSEGAL